MSSGEIQQISVSTPAGIGQPTTKNVIVEASVVNNNGGKALMNTQAEQNAADEETRRKVTDDLVQSWEDRLQQISVITTFFASIEAGLLTMTTPISITDMKGVAKASNTFLVGALVLHVYAAILSFLAGFLLTGFKLAEANQEEAKIEDAEAMAALTAGKIHIEDVEKNGHLVDEVDVSFLSYHNNRTSTLSNTTNATAPTPPRLTPRNSKFLHHKQKVVSSNPHMERSGLLFKHGQPSHLLSRFHSVCILIASIGFGCAMLGILMYAWALHPTEVAAFATACFGSAIISGLVILAPV